MTYFAERDGEYEEAFEGPAESAFLSDEDPGDAWDGTDIDGPAREPNEYIIVSGARDIVGYVFAHSARQAFAAQAAARVEGTLYLKCGGQGD